MLHVFKMVVNCWTLHTPVQHLLTSFWSLAQQCTTSSKYSLNPHKCRWKPAPGNALCQGAFAKPLSFVKQIQEQAVLQTEKYKNSVRATLPVPSSVPLQMITEIFKKCSLKTQKIKAKQPQQFPLCPHVLACRMGLLLVVSRCKETDHKFTGRTLQCTFSQLRELL